MLKLIVGNKNYSSWSMRPWVLMTQTGIPFEETTVWLGEADTRANIARWSPAGTVPVLVDGDLTVSDSLAICEYLAEQYPDKSLWPRDPGAGGPARALGCVMDASFGKLRAKMPMNVRNRYPGKGMTPEVAADIARVSSIWSEYVTRSGGPYLFGSFCIADAMYAPVVLRFQTYGVALEGAAAAYQQTMLRSSALVKLAEAAAAEGHAQPGYDTLYG